MKDFDIYYGKDICHICQKPSYIKIRYRTRDSRPHNTIHFVSLCNDCANMIENEWRERFHKEKGDAE